MPLLVEVTHLVDLQHGVVPYNLGLALACGPYSLRMRHSWPVADDVATAWLTVNLPNAFHYESQSDVSDAIARLARGCYPQWKP